MSAAERVVEVRLPPVLVPSLPPKLSDCVSVIVGEGERGLLVVELDITSVWLEPVLSVGDLKEVSLALSERLPPLWRELDAEALDDPEGSTPARDDVSETVRDPAEGSADLDSMRVGL